MDMAQFISGIQTSNVSLSQSGRADVFAEAAVGKGWGFFRAQAGARASASCAVSDTTSYNVNYEAVDRTFGLSYGNARNDVNEYASQRAEEGQPVSMQEREEMLFDRFAYHLNRDMGQLVDNLKDNKDGAIGLAEDLEEVPVTDSERRAEEERERRSRNYSGNTIDGA